MVTFPQLIRQHRKTKQFRSSTPHFNGCPFKYGTCLRVGVVKPKKPNSAQRKIAKVRLTNDRQLIAYIPGFGHKLQKNSEVMVRGGRVPDLPGVRYHIMRGKKDLIIAEAVTRVHRRSKFGKALPNVKVELTLRATNKIKARKQRESSGIINEDDINNRLLRMTKNFKYNNDI